MLAADDEHVLRLQVAVHEPLRVQRRDRAAQLAEHRERHGQRDRPAPEHARERLADELLHREVRATIRQRADREHLDDVRMTDRREALCLCEELRALLLGAHKLRMQHLQRDATRAPHSVVNDATSAFAEHGVEAKVTEGRGQIHARGASP